jgi:N-acetylglucosamine malate deacetylase 1
MNRLFKKVLILAPHTDDGELGCGGTISKLLEEGSKIFYVAFSSAGESLKENGFKEDVLLHEVKAATSALGIKNKNLIIYNYKVRFFHSSRQKILNDMIKLKNNLKPELVIMPSLNDLHQDHNIIAQEALRAFKNTTLIAYELIWNNLNFQNTMFVTLDEKHVQTKWNSLNKYKSQKNKNYMNKDFIFSLARARGVQIATKYAESFEVIRWVI